MGQYLQFRSWARRSSGAEKGVLATSLAVVLGLTGWALVPTSSGSRSASIGQSPGPGPAASPVPAGPTEASSAVGPAAATATSAATNGAPAPAAGPAPAGAAVAGGAPASQGTGTSARAGGAAPGRGAPTAATARPAASSSASACGPLTATDQGVSATQIRIAGVLIDLGGAIGNGAVGEASPQDQQAMAQAIVDDINSHGGVACRKLSITFLTANPIDSNSAHQACLTIASGGFFAAVDLGGLAFPAGSADCVAQKKVPILATAAPTPSEIRTYGSYVFSTNYDQLIDQRNAVLGMNSRGWFSPANGFKKLGMVMDECSAEVNQATFDALASIGIQKKDISIASVACPSGGFASPSDMEAAVIQHVRDGVTNVIPVIGGGSFKEYSTAAQRQGFKPKYTTTDYQGFQITATGGTGPDTDNFDGTVSVSSTRIGENTTPGLTDPATQACIELFKRHGLSPDLVFPSDPSKYPNGGLFCAELETLAAAIDKAPSLTRPNIVVGLTRLGRVPMAYPIGDAVFDHPGKVTGGDFWWVVQFSKACTCWKVIDPVVHPKFA